jgi:AcrR family transcriptional regulator
MTQDSLRARRWGGHQGQPKAGLARRSAARPASAWLREEQPDVAVDRILDAADEAFAELGIAAAGMTEIAGFAGCSRGTVYRYFGNRHQLHLAYVDRAARQIGERVHASLGAIEDPRERLVEAILGSIREVRRNPGTAAWFDSGASELAARMSRSSEVVETLTKAFVSHLLGRLPRGREQRLRARWLVRVVISLLAAPEESRAEERLLVERFVVPALVP